MEVNRRKSAPNIVAGSVWESRMKLDEVKGGIKVFNGEEDHKQETNNGDHVEQTQSDKTLESKQNGVVREKRKTWKQEPIEVVGRNPIQSRKIRLEPNKFISKSCKDFSVSLDGIEKNPIQVKHTRSHKDVNESLKEVDVCKENIISSSLSTLGHFRNPKSDCSDHDEDEVEDKEEKVSEKSFDVKEVDVTKKIVKEEKKVSQIYRKPIPISPIVTKHPPLLKDHSIIEEDVKKPSPAIDVEEFDEEVFEECPQTQINFHNIVDLVMWEDVAKSAFVFGLGSFILISSSYTEELNLSLTSAISYMGLVYLAAIFTYKSFISRGDGSIEDSIHLIGEEEAIWLVKLILPYFNELLLKLKAIFSGDPATTMKLAVLLFVLARFGSFITIGKLVKLGFFGAFTIPKVCSSYSDQLSAYGHNIRDLWRSCSRNKAVAIVAFILLLNFSSLVTRIWAVFMLAVAVQYYQMSSPGEAQGKVENDDNANAWQGGRRQRQGVWANRGNPVKDKKGA